MVKMSVPYLLIGIASSIMLFTESLQEYLRILMCGYILLVAGFMAGIRAR